MRLVDWLLWESVQQCIGHLTHFCARRHRNFDEHVAPNVWWICWECRSLFTYQSTDSPYIVSIILYASHSVSNPNAIIKIIFEIRSLLRAELGKFESISRKYCKHEMSKQLLELAVVIQRRRIGWRISQTLGRILMVLSDRKILMMYYSQRSCLLTIVDICA